MGISRANHRLFYVNRGQQPLSYWYYKIKSWRAGWSGAWWNIPCSPKC